MLVSPYDTSAEYGKSGKSAEFYSAIFWLKRSRNDMNSHFSEVLFNYGIFSWFRKCKILLLQKLLPELSWNSDRFFGGVNVLWTEVQQKDIPENFCFSCECSFFSYENPCVFCMSVCCLNAESLGIQFFRKKLISFC